MNGPNPSGLCRCGCGQTTTLYKGKHRFCVVGHQHVAADRVERIKAHRAQWIRAGIEYGLCLCGCGEQTLIASETEYSRHRIKGEPRPWVPRHHARSTPNRWREEDRGYNTPCWIWQWSMLHNGYGQGQGLTAHRKVYEELVGPVPPGLDLDHLCRVRACVNPEHLEPVTRAVNAQRGQMAKLTMPLARSIRAEFQAWTGSKFSFCKMVAARHEMHPFSIDTVLQGKTWKDD